MFGGIGQFGAGAVVQREHQMPFGEIFGRRNYPLQFALDIKREGIDPTDREQANFVLKQIIQFAL